MTQSDKNDSVTYEDDIYVTLWQQKIFEKLRHIFCILTKSVKCYTPES